MDTDGDGDGDPVGDAPPVGARLAAAAALVVLAGSVALLVAFVLHHPGYLVVAAIALGLAVSAVWIALTNRRWRWLAVVALVVVTAGAVASMVAAGSSVLVIAGVVAGTALSGALGTVALRHEVRRAAGHRWHDVPGAVHPVLLMNPKSGGGKVVRFRLADEATARGIEGVVLAPGDDLETLARAAVDRGADVLGMAGGDGSQAIVASVAAEHGLAYVCVPAGTRNHLALDLGVERDDPVGALDAFGPARESLIDLGTVNGRVFVNNVSLGLYAEIVASDGYRDAKVRTTAQTLEHVLGPDAPPFDLQVRGPRGGLDGCQLVQVSNNPYVLDSLAGFGTRRRLDTGMLGVVAVRVDGPAEAQRLVALEVAGHVERFPGWRSWDVPSAEVLASSTVPAGVDGESVVLTAPVRFESRPAALRVRVAHGHPGVSPAQRRVPLAASTVVGLWALVRGRPSGLVA